MQKTTVNFGNFLRKERKRIATERGTKFGQQQLANELGIGMNNYAHYEMGVRYPHDVEMWNKLAGLFKWTPDQVVRLQQEVKKEYDKAVNVG